MQTRRQFLRYSLLPAMVASRLPLYSSPADEQVHIDPDSLRAHAEKSGLEIGCAVNPEKLRADPDYAKLVAAEAGLLVAENAMKWRALRPAPDKFDFSGADEIMAFAAKAGQRVRGHNLCWHKALPDWFSAVVTRQNAHTILVEHIQTVVGRYAGRIHSWDVVNEPIDLKDHRTDGLRQSPWVDLLGPEYIELAFRTAREADPKALLTWNETGIQHDSQSAARKRDQMLYLLKQLKSRGVPIDAVGIESHLSATGSQPGSGVRNFVRELHRLGLMVFLTELDVSEEDLKGSEAERDGAIARVYKDYLSMMLAEPNVTAVVTWGITDRYTPLDKEKYERADHQPQRPLPFDADYRPKPAFFAIRDALDQRARSMPK
jgi:endo-1,4-beta-xylanase